MTRRVLVPLLFGLTAVAVLGQGRHAEGHATASQAGAPSATPLYTDEDVMFLAHMVVHHQQAIDMAALVPARSGRTELLKFARYVADAQHSEIEQMKALLEAAADRGPVPHHEMSGDPPMRGMLSKAQMAALQAASGVEFERLWLQGMIDHHQGAIDMALAQQQRQFERQRQPYGIAAMADDVLTTQRAEIGIMKKWLTRWGLGEPARDR
jgi:uncharacterized protein (DUF305 family)